MSYDDSPEATTPLEAADLVLAARLGTLSRGELLRRALALGLSGSALASVLAACGGGGDEGGGGGAEGGATPVDEAEEIVYPEGFTSDPNYRGPNGGDKLAVLPDDYFEGTDQHGIPKWKFYDFKADKPYRLAFAHFSAKWDLSVEMTARMKRAARKMGCEMQTFDNNFDADQAIRNADLIAQQRFDYCIEAQIFPDANKTIFQKLKSAGIDSSYLAVEGPEGSTFFDHGNYRMFSELGKWLGNYAKDNWDGQVDLVILGAQPRAGKYVAERERGARAGLKEALPDLKDSVFVEVDTQGLLDEAQKKAADVLTSRAEAKYIVGVGTNDDVGVGITRAIEAAGKGRFAAVSGQAGQASAVEELKKRQSPFKVSAFLDNETWTWMAAVAVLKLMGGDTAPVNFVPYYMTTSENVRDFPPQAGTLT